MKSRGFALGLTGTRLSFGKFKNGVKIKRKRADSDRGLA